MNELGGYEYVFVSDDWKQKHRWRWRFIEAYQENPLLQTFLLISIPIGLTCLVIVIAKMVVG